MDYYQMEISTSSAEYRCEAATASPIREDESQNIREERERKKQAQRLRMARSEESAS